MYSTVTCQGCEYNKVQVKNVRQFPVYCKSCQYLAQAGSRYLNFQHGKLSKAEIARLQKDRTVRTGPFFDVKNPNKNIAAQRQGPTLTGKVFQPNQDLGQSQAISNTPGIDDKYNKIREGQRENLEKMGIRKEIVEKIIKEG